MKRNINIDNFLFLHFCIKNNQIKQTNNKNIILVEFNQYSPCLISYYYFMNSLFNLTKSNFYLINIDIKKKINNFFFYLFFYCIGARREVKFKKNKNLNHFKEFQKLKNKTDIINYHNSQINIGKDIYEGYLRTYNQPTIDLNDKNFKFFFIEYLEYFEDMACYVEKHQKNIKALIVFQTLYKYNMLCKLAYKYNIPVYLPDLDKFHMNLNEFDETKKFNEYRVRSLKLLNKDDKIKKVEKIFNGRLNGIQPNELSYSTALLDNSQKKYNNIFDKEKNTKVLVCSHCFYDNPHPFEKSAFPDYFEWLDFICKLSKETNYSWRIKVHNDCLPGTIETINFIIKKNKSNVKLLPKDITHSEIVNDKVTHVLTCHGTVGFEYPYFDIPVINFNYNPRISFNFNLNANNDINNYRRMLINLENTKDIDFNKSDLFLSYYMHYFDNVSNLFVNNYYEIFAKTSLKDKDYFFSEFLENWNNKKEKNIKLQVENFIKSKKNYLCWRC